MKPDVRKLAPVLQLVNGEVYSGLERVVDHLAGHADALGIEMHLAMLKPGLMRSRMKTPGVRLHELPMRSRFDFGVVSQAAALVRELGCRLIHSHTVRSAIIARRVQRATGLSWVHHVHSPALHESERRGLNLVNFLAEFVVMRHADRVIAVSQPLVDYTVRHYGVDEARVVCVPNGVGRVAGQAARDGTSLRVLTTGLYRRRKGIENIVHAAAALRAAGHVFEWRVVGEFSDIVYCREIRAMLADQQLEGWVQLKGFCADVESHLRAADLFVCPSLYGEGMPMAVLEAMAHGVPVVASDIDGVRDVLAEGAGLLVPVGSPSELARAVQSLLLDMPRRLELGERGRQRQAEHFSVESLCNRVFEIYRELMPPGHPAVS